MSEFISFSRDSGIFTIRFDRPAKKNALTSEMYTRVRELLEQAATDPGIRVLLFTGGPEVFTSGNDIVDFLQNPPTDEATAPVLQLLHAIVDFEKPVVAAVTGLAVGIGTTLLLHCDLSVVGESARFSMPFVNLGLCPEAASSLILPERVGSARAAEWLMLGEMFGAAEALSAGLVNRVVADAQVEAVARELAVKLAAKPPAALRATKQLLKGHLRAAQHAQMSAEASSFAAALQGPEAKEAFSAFVEKRAPDFSKFG